MSTETLLLALGIVSSSFFGSWHCGAMCGPMVTVMKARGALGFYQFGRLISYVTLGLLAGGIGAVFLGSTFATLRSSAAVILAAGLVLIGLKLIFPKQLQRISVTPKAHALMSKLQRLSGLSATRSGFAMGLLSGLLPCGWLYTYVFAALATKSALAGGVTMGLFWLGGLPLLTAVPALLKAGIAAAGLKQQRIAGAILVVSSLYSLIIFLSQN